MPSAKKKPKPILPVPPKESPPPPEPILPPKPPSLPVIYDRMEITDYSTTSQKGPLSVERCKVILGWETEKEYQQRKVKQFPDTNPQTWLFGDTFHCKDVAGNKVRCNSNAGNRSFDMEWCEALIHTILHGQWAGPHTIPGETVNGETVRVSRYGRVISGQHQTTACILADEWLHKTREQIGMDATNQKYPAWAKHNNCFIETIVITGMSEDPRVLMTVDYVKPRTAADMFYTSDVFKSSSQQDRKELCKLLSVAVDNLWVRTDARGYRTHPEVVGFLERHMKTLKCVEHLHHENSAEGNRKISKLRLNAGQCAALMYLMGCSNVSEDDSEEYRNSSPPTEKGLDWSLWNRAEEFWIMLASGKDFLPVRNALGSLTDSTPENENNQGLGGRGPEKLAILAKAWERWKTFSGVGTPFDEDDIGPGGQLCLSYSNLDDKGNKLPNGEIKLLDVADFYGIDCPDSAGKGKTSKAPPDPPAPSREEIERLAEEALKRRQSAAK